MSVRTEAGNTSAGIVAPENNNIGKYSRLVTTFMDFVVLQTAATSSPMENMETIVSTHNRIKIKILGSSALRVGEIIRMPFIYALI